MTAINALPMAAFFFTYIFLKVISNFSILFLLRHIVISLAKNLCFVFPLNCDFSFSFFVFLLF